MIKKNKKEAFFENLNNTRKFLIVTGIDGVLDIAAEMHKKYGFYMIGEPQKTGIMIEIAGEEYPEFAAILMKKEAL